MMSERKIEDILVDRDGCTKTEAKKRVEETRQMLNDCNWDADEVEDIMYGELGLELDYIFQLI